MRRKAGEGDTHLLMSSVRHGNDKKGQRQRGFW